MKWFGIGTAVMAAAITAGSGLSYGMQQGSQAVPPHGQADHGQAASTDARAFVNDMTIAGLAEVQLGKMASEKGSSADVKSFGQMMVKDHSQANDELKQAAAQLKIQPPREIDQKHKDLASKLSKLQGAEFDREYVNAMVQGHQEVLGKLRARTEAATSGAHGAADPSVERAPERGLPSTTTNSNKPVAQDSATAKAQAGKGATSDHGAGNDALTQWAAKVLPKVQMHLDRANELQQKNK